MRWRPIARPASPAPEPARTPPLPENPYRRFYTRTPPFEELVRRSKGHPAEPEKK